jgi:hypothetical protein
MEAKNSDLTLLPPPRLRAITNCVAVAERTIGSIGPQTNSSTVAKTILIVIPYEIAVTTTPGINKNQYNGAFAL